MRLSIEADEFGRLVCRIADGRSEAAVRSADPAAARADMLAALDGFESDGYSECFWREPNGEYRWIFRQEGVWVRIVVLRSAGTMTGWEHVFSGEEQLAGFAEMLRDEVSAA
jgi:hypothetical protein